VQQFLHNHTDESATGAAMSLCSRCRASLLASSLVLW
jgi:hypothetical protein